MGLRFGGFAVHWVLYPVSLVFGVFAAVIYAGAENIIHQNLAVNITLVGSVLFVGGIIAQLLERIAKLLDDED